MNFEFTESQQLLADTIARFVSDHYDLERRNKLVAHGIGFSADHWSQFAELGWLALPFSEDDGGFGGTALDLIILFEEFGKGLVVEPYLASIVLGGGVIARTTHPERAAWLADLQSGKRQLSLGFVEPQARYDLNDVTTTARRDGDGYVLNGAKSVVLNAVTADAIIVSARTGGGQTDSEGVVLVMVEPGSTGVSLDNFNTVDGLRASELTLDNVRVPADAVLGGDAGAEILASVVDDGIIAVCAEAVGAMEVLYKDTVAYTQEREQFGHPLAEFQVLQHRMVDMFVEYELSKSLLYRAAMEMAGGVDTARRTVHALKHRVGKAATFIGESAVQLHGGMGVTEELRVGHYFKRLTVIESMFGDADHHLQEFVAAG